MRRFSTGKFYYDETPGATDFDWCVIDYPSRIKANQKKQPTETPKEETKEKKTVADNRLTKFCDLMYTACAE